MNDDETKTLDSPFSEAGNATITANTYVQDGRCRDYEIPFTKSGSSIKQAKRKPDDIFGAVEKPTPPDSSSARYSIRQWATNARNASSRTENAVKNGDFMEATSAGGVLTDSLSELWRLRSHRESEFAEIINILQIVLAKVHFEQLSSDQCAAITKLLDECVLAGATDESDVRYARQLLREVGLDAWRALSFRDED